MTTYKISVYSVQLVKDCIQRVPENTISTPDIAASIAREYLAGADREHMIVLLVNTKHRIVGINTVSIGTLSSTICLPREVFKPAILANAAAVLLAHNHPSGDPTPSPQDIELTKRIKDAGELLGIPLLDHIIIGEERHYSLKAHEEMVEQMLRTRRNSSRRSKRN